MSSPGISLDQLLAQQAQGISPNMPVDPLDAALSSHASQPVPAPNVNAVAPEQNGDPNWRQQLMGGPVGQFMGGAMQPVYGVDQLAYKGLGAATSLGGLYPNQVSDFMENRAKAVGDEAAASNKSYGLAAKLTGNTPHGAPEVMGQIVSPANFVAGAVSTPSKLGTALLQGAALGATSPADNGDNYWLDKSGQIGFGTATGGLLHGGGKVLRAIADPVSTYGAKVATLLKAGVPLTTGQIMGGTIHRLEDAATSIPFVGDMIRNRQRDASVAFANAPINKALSFVGDRLPDGASGNQAIKYAQNSMDTAYQSVLGKMSADADPQLKTELDGIVNRATGDYGLAGADKEKLKDLIQGQIIEKSDKGFYDGAALKDVQSNLSYQQRQYSHSQNPNDKNLSDALRDVKSSFNDMLSRQNPDHAPELANINEGYANLVRPETAAANATKDGVYTPAQLAMAVKRGGTRSQNAAGEALQQDLSSAGQSVLPSTVPDSGTPFRHFVQAGATLTGAGIGGEHFVPGATEAALGAAGLGMTVGLGGTKAAQDIFRAALTKRPYSADTAKRLGLILMNAPAVVGRIGIPAAMPLINNNGPQ